MVLDPWIALTVACSVVQFVDFSVKIISKGNQYYKSTDGALQQNTEHIATANAFRRLSHGLSRSLDALSQERKLSHDEKALQLVAQNCKDLASTLRTTVDRLRLPENNKRWKSFRHALKTYWSKEEIEDMVRKLRSVREELVIHLLVVMSNRQLLEAEAVANQNKRLERLLLEAIQASGSEIRGQVAELSANLGKASREERSGLNDRWQLSNREEVLEISGIMSRVAQENQHRRIQELVLHSLDFPQLRDRHARIVEAHPATFDWIFERNFRQEVPWADFVHWLSSLEGDKPLYWMTGKPGSGKSTLMRYLYNHTLTKRYLGQWAGTKHLIIASCFFWNPGADLQKSHIGLLRTLLFELLQQVPALIKSVNLWRWQSYELGSSALVPWTLREPKEGFQNLLEETEDSVKVCLFVDGLDEFEGDDTARTEIITLFKTASCHPHVKVCVSSRPWPIFEDAFKSRPSLLLQDLTDNDIRKYVQSELVDNERFVKLKESEPKSCAELAANIVDRAQGVFLWVRLVVMDLLQGLRNEGPTWGLKKKIRSYAG